MDKKIAFRVLLNEIHILEVPTAWHSPGYRTFSRAHVPRLLVTSGLARILIGYARRRSFGPVVTRSLDGHMDLLTEDCLLEVDLVARSLLARPRPDVLPLWIKGQSAVANPVADRILIDLTSSL